MRDETRTARHRPTTEAIAIREAFPTITILFVHQKNNKNALVNEAKSLPKCFGDPELGRGLLSSDTLPPPLVGWEEDNHSPPSLKASASQFSTPQYAARVPVAIIRA